MTLAGAPVTYRAFISYSHRDATFARRLHRQLESYRLPSKLVGTETARGIVPDRLSPIFRDREELSAGESLSDQVLAALAASEALIIICSPNAKASLWVGKEIENFRTLHPDRPVLAALIDGEPDEAFPAALLSAPLATASPSPLVGEGRGEGQAASAAPENPEEAKTDTAPGSQTRAAPQPPSGHPLPQGESDGAIREPIAADFRKGKDGHRLARLKLAAGLTGVPLDALVQRDAQRQFRRVMAVTIAAGIALLVMAGLLVMALQARREADRQRQEAEGLVEYMLTDLRDKLKGVGRLDVMTAVNERAMSYYGGQQALEGLPSESLDRRARILHAMGEDDEKRGDLDKALAKFKEAHRTTEAVLAQMPDDADAIFAHAQSEYWVGYGAKQTGRKDMAYKHWGSYLEKSLDLSKREPTKARSSLEVGYAYGNLCDLYFSDSDNIAAARTNCELSLKNEHKALLIDPKSVEIKTALANRYGWTAKILDKLGLFGEATSARDAERSILSELLAGDQNNVELGMRLVASALGLASSRYNTDRFQDSLSYANQALEGINKIESITGQTRETVELRMRSMAAKARSAKQLNQKSWITDLDMAKRDLVELKTLAPDYIHYQKMQKFFREIEESDR